MRLLVYPLQHGYDVDLTGKIERTKKKTKKKCFFRILDHNTNIPFFFFKALLFICCFLFFSYNSKLQKQY